MFWKYVANLQEITHAEVFSEDLFLRTNLDGWFCSKDISAIIKSLDTKKASKSNYIPTRVLKD